MSVLVSRIRALLLVPTTALMVLSAPTVLHAQMGGMGGGGMGGGMGGRGGMGGGPGGRPGGPGSRTPVDVARDRMKQTDPLAFLLDHKKELALTKAQQDTFKVYRKELEEKQSPVFKDLQKVSTEEPANGGAANGGGRGGMGGGMGGRDGRRPPSDSAGRDAAGPFASDAVRALFSRLADIQDAYRDRARTKLDETQRVRADSIQNAALEKQREKMQNRG
ncbi:MAG TPA: hypothetical protein DGD08_03495 [Gemmatimonas aurantiaca]|uniref:LTXXQ motif family protein n=2 Tax=Gemmatimonas aurantiaca TaxID=173480 RepID=C1A852_GEMAT|nr:hypothetical protein [Gemmatimonas aurantiaca]BAH38412.1 hypothetical protein GAU_1370 [Gemmatimonas aurantiaca T-27]HCT56259.1 hypothetical protein [Gemmatimonas aurantiaca]